MPPYDAPEAFTEMTPRPIDHLVLAGHDLEALRATYTRLGSP
jgi:hypothetical protein